MAIIFFDTETTGNTEADTLCQLAIKERGVANPIVYETYKPQTAISIDSMAIHHITNKMVENRPLFKDAPTYTQAKQLFENHETIPVAHNAQFDISMLLKEDISPVTHICTLKVARYLDSEDSIPSYRLQYLRYYLNLEAEGAAHDAWGDVVVLEALFERLLKKMMEVENLDEKAALKRMAEISLQPSLIKVIRFGKYAGQKVADIAKTDKGYLQWLLGQKKQNEAQEVDWIYTLNYYLEK